MLSGFAFVAGMSAACQSNTAVYRWSLARVTMSFCGLLMLLLSGCGGGGGGGGGGDSSTPETPGTVTAFSFVDQVDVSPSTPIESASITVAGVTSAVAISVTGGEYSIDNGPFTASNGSVAAGHSVKARHTSASTPSTTVDTRITIGGVSDTFSSTTRAAVVGGDASYNVILGRPTAASIAISVLAKAGDKAFVEYGLQSAAPGAYSNKTAAVGSADGSPLLFELTGLSADADYFYRINLQANGASAFVANDEHRFHTQRKIGQSFSFGVQGDSHPERYNNKMFHADLYKLTMAQVAAHRPDLYFMLGDDFSIEKHIQDFKDANFGAGHVFTKAVEGAWSFSDYLSKILHPFVQSDIGEGTGGSKLAGYGAYLEQREKYLYLMAHSTSLFLVNGNHEQAHQANLGGVFNNAAVWAADARNKFYPLPAPDGFYSGDTQAVTGVNGYPGVAGDGLLRDYYAFTWGDALFVTIDPYWHSPFSPDSNLYNGDAEPEWGISMGDAQYQWLKTTLETSTAKYKFVFAHHVNGNNRGAAVIAASQEWGGNSRNGSYGFPANRPTWAKPIHQLMVDTGVSIFFQGHDHIFSREVVDGVVYQSVPNPADNSYWAYNCSAYDPATIPAFKSGGAYGQYDPDYGVVMPNSGFLNVTVSAQSVRVDYIRTYRDVDLQSNSNGQFNGSAVNGEIAFSYSLPAQPGDDLARDHAYSCQGDAPPSGHVYHP